MESETQKGYNYYRCTKKKGKCSQKYIREELLAEQISNIIQKVSLPSAWTKKMILELDKEKEKNIQAEAAFVQNFRQQITKLDEKLDKLLDLQLSGVISTEEYAAKKQKFSTKKLRFPKN